MTNLKAIVTGHTKGLGAALTRQLLKRAIPVLGLARTSSPSFANDFPSLFAEVAIDLGNMGALASWLHTDILRQYLDKCSTVLLINNAGMVQPVGALSQQDPDEVAMAVTLNVAAPLMLSAAVIRATPGIPRRLLHISSGAGASAYPGWSVYCATKAALDHHARAVSLAAEDGVRICSLAPGVIDTDMQAEIRATSAARFPIRQRFVDLKAAGHLITPDVCATQVINYLLDDKFGTVPVADLRNS